MRSMLLALAVTLAVLAPSASAQSFTVADLRPVVDRGAFAGLLEAAGMERQERTVAELLYADYAVELEALAERIDQAQREAGRDRLEAALAGRIMMDADALRRSRAEVRRAASDAWSDADELARGLLTSVADLLFSPEAEAAFERERGVLRRAMRLAPRRERERDPEYAGEGVDLALLVAAERRERGSLADADVRMVDAIIADWTRRVNTVLDRDAAAFEAAREGLAAARILRDSSEVERLERACLERWAAQFATTAQAAGEIARCPGADGPAFLVRFDRACLPWLWSAAEVDREALWIERQGIGADASARAAGIAAAWLRDRAAATREAIDLVTTTRGERGVLLQPRMDPREAEERGVAEAHRDLLRLTGRLAGLDADASAAIAALLSERDRKRMRADLRADALRGGR